MPRKVVVLALVLACRALLGCANRDASAAPIAASASDTSVAAALPSETASASPPPPASVSTEPVLIALDAGPEEPAIRQPCPEGMALVDRFCIDRWEAVLYAPGADGGLSLLPHNERPAEGVRFEARSLPGVLPQAYISRVEAGAACKNAGKRLCSMREWRRTCEGRRSTKFPYGDRRVAGRCNHEKPHLLSLRFGSDARRWTYEDFNEPSLNIERGFLAPTGEHQGCGTAEEVFDLVGNLHEWVSDKVDEPFMEKFEAEKSERRSQSWRVGNGVFLGGFFSTHEQLGQGCTFTTVAHEPAYHDYSVGFRCCSAADLPPPAKRKPRKER